MMASLELILIFLLLVEAGITRRNIFINHRAGHDATLTCNDPSDTKCSTITWLYNRNPYQTFTEVQKGKFKKGSGRAARMSLDTSCSLVLNNITAEDVGVYTCRQGSNAYEDVSTNLSVLTISPSPADADPKRDDEVTLECSLLRYTEFGPCKLNSIRWVDETGAVLRGKGVGYEFLGQLNCASFLAVKRQSGHNRRYTCQVVDKENNVEVQADYTPDFKGGSRDEEAEKSNSDYITLVLQIAGLIPMIIITVLVVSNRGNTKPLHNDNNVHRDDDKVSYENVEACSAATGLH